MVGRNAVIPLIVESYHPNRGQKLLSAITGTKQGTGDDSPRLV